VRKGKYILVLLMLLVCTGLVYIFPRLFGSQLGYTLEPFQYILEIFLKLLMGDFPLALNSIFTIAVTEVNGAFGYGWLVGWL
jgi:hypothetical protein